MSLRDGGVSPARVGRTTVGAIALRAGHVASMSVVVGGAWTGAAGATLRPWFVATTVTGLTLVALEIGHGREWPWQGRGVLALAHVAVLGLAALPGGVPAGTMAALVLGMAGSHMPRAWRKWSFRRGAAVDD